MFDIISYIPFLFLFALIVMFLSSAVRILPEYERASARHVTIEYGASAALKRTIEGGQAFDLAILTPTVIDDLINENKITAGTHTDVARSDLGVGIRAGASRSDISTADALKRRLLAATSITYAPQAARFIKASGMESLAKK